MDSLDKIKDRLSWWETDYYLNNVDVTILGAGIVGLSTAIELKQMSPELNILLIDKKTIPIGASTKNAGFACFGSVSEILDDIDRFGEHSCRQLIAMRARGLELLKGRIPSVEMDYSDQPGIEIFDDDEVSKYIEKIPFINDLVYDILGEKQCFKLREGRLGLEIINRLEGSLNPQKMMSFLELKARNIGVKFLMGIEVQKIRNSSKELETKSGSIFYNKLMVCTNGFSTSLLPDMDIQPARNQVIITKPMRGFSLDGCYHMHKGYVYFREVSNRLLLGGGRHINMLDGNTEKLENTTEIISYLKEIAKNKILNVKEVKIDHIWSGILGVGADKMPIVKKISDDVFVTIRMGGMGVAIGSYIGRVSASIFLEDRNSDLELFVSS